MSRKKLLMIITLIFVFVIIGCMVCFVVLRKAESSNRLSPIVSLELQKLDIAVTGKSKQMEEEIPLSLIGLPWEMTKIVCEKGGYDLTPYVGKSVLSSVYPINEVWGGTEPLNVWVMTGSNGEIVCVYKSVRGGSTAAPGVFSTKDNFNIEKK